MNTNIMQMNTAPINTDSKFNGISAGNSQAGNPANDFEEVLKAILSGLNNGSMLVNNNGRPVNISDLTKGLLDQKNIELSTKGNISDVLQQIMAQFQMQGMAPSMVSVNSDEQMSVGQGTNGTSGNISGTGSLPGLPSNENGTNGLLTSAKTGTATGFINQLNDNAGTGGMTQQQADAAATTLQVNNKVVAVPAQGAGKDSVDLRDMDKTDSIKSTGDRAEKIDKSSLAYDLTRGLQGANLDKGKDEVIQPGMAASFRTHEFSDMVKDVKIVEAPDDKTVQNRPSDLLASVSQSRGSVSDNNNSIPKETVHISRLNELSDPIAKNAGSGERHIIIKLDPPEMGSIQIKLRMENGVLRADFKVDSNTVKDLFSSAMPQIKTSLEDSGIKSGDFSVDLKENNSQYSGGDQKKDEKYNNPQQQQKDQKKPGPGFFEFFA